MTVSDMVTLLSQLLSDSNQEVWVESTHLLPTLNSAQDDLVNMMLGLVNINPKYKRLIDLLSELQETETISIDVSGFDLSGTTDREFLTNGYVSSKVTINNKIKYPTKIGQDKIGFESNRFLKGNDRSPRIVIWKNKLNLYVDDGSLPAQLELYYIGKPYKMAASASGSGLTRLVDTCDLNPLLHNYVVKIAQTKCLTMRSDERDNSRVAILLREIQGDIAYISSGGLAEASSDDEPGQYLRKSEVRNASR